MEVLRLGKISALEEFEELWWWWGTFSVRLLRGPWLNKSPSGLTQGQSACPMQSLTDLDPRTTVLSVDGVGAFDLISSNSMMQGLLHMEGGEKLLPFVRMFHSTPSTFLWEDEEGTVHHNTSHRVKAASRVTP